MASACLDGIDATGTEQTAGDSSPPKRKKNNPYFVVITHIIWRKKVQQRSILRASPNASNAFLPVLVFLKQLSDPKLFTLPR
jgi:hypothetical protein